MKTRDRILFTARTMFNEHGYGNVSLARLAQSLNMTKGNLWYHFNDKRSLLEALSNELIKVDQQRRMIAPIEGNILASYVDFLRTLASGMRDFRFLFRDHADYGEHTQSMLEQLPIIYDESLQQLSRFFIAMKNEGYLIIEDAAINPLAVNVVIVTRYNVEFLRERGLLSAQGAGVVEQTLEQHLTLFADKLTAEANNVLHKAIKNQPTR